MEKRYERTMLATACVPWTAEGVFDEAVFRELVRTLRGKGVTNIYIFGTAGEGYAVTREQFTSVTAAFAEEMWQAKPMVGVVSLSLGEMLQRVETAYALGIRDFQFSLPSWGALNDAELPEFLHRLLDPFPDCRFLHYNLMRTKRVLNIGEYEMLAKELPNFCGVKYSNPDVSVMLAIARSSCPLRFFVTEFAYGAGAQLFDCGFLVSIASSNLERAWAYYRAGVEGDGESLRVMMAELNRLSAAMVECAGGGMMDGAYDKMFCRLNVPEFSLRLLPPYQCCKEEGFLAYADFIKTNLPQWL